MDSGIFKEFPKECEGEVKRLLPTVNSFLHNLLKMPSQATSSLSENLQKARREAGISQRSAATKLGISNVTVSNHERGETTPDEEQIEGYARLYGWSEVELRYGKDALQRPAQPHNDTPSAQYGLVSETTRLPRQLEILAREFELEAVKAGADEEDERYIRTALRSPEAMQLYRGGYAESMSIDEQRIEMESLIEMLRTWLKERIRRRKIAQRRS
jgi:transcriptional regulator with XRE-family HTH domain